MNARKCPPGETVREHYAHGGKLLDEPVLPDEDLTTPEHLLHGGLAKRNVDRSLESAAGVVREIGGEMLESFKQPAFRAGFGAALLSSAMLARMGSRASVAIIMSLMIGATVEQLYAMAEDIHETSVAQREYLAVLAKKAAGDAAGEV